jgi:hypothetical protein
MKSAETADGEDPAGFDLTHGRVKRCERQLVGRDRAIERLKP